MCQIPFGNEKVERRREEEEVNEDTLVTLLSNTESGSGKLFTLR